MPKSLVRNPGFVNRTSIRSQSMAYKINDGLPVAENLISFIDLGIFSVRIGEDRIYGPLTSRSLKAARLFRPWTLASFTNLSFACRSCHLLEDEDAARVGGANGVHRIPVLGFPAVISKFKPSYTVLVCKPLLG